MRLSAKFNFASFFSLLLPLFILHAQNDTLKDYFERSSGYKVYKYQSTSFDTYPLTGSNDMYFMLGSKFLFNGNANISGVLVAFASKNVIVNDKHQIIVYHLDPVGNMPSGTAIGVGEFYLDKVDTNGTTPVFTYLDNWQKKPNITQNFGIMLHTRTRSSGDDSYAVWSNKQTDGMAQKTCFDLWIDQNNKWHYEDIYDFPLKTEINGNPDIDVMIIPVIDFSNDINELISFSGFKIRSIINTEDHLNLKIEFEETGNLELSIITLNGQIIKNINYPIINLGNNNILIDLNEIANGYYFYSINFNKKKFAGKFIK